MRRAPSLLGLIWPFIVVVLVQTAIAGFSIYTLSAVRAYVGGESHWSKGQKNAIHFLGLYADTRNDSYFQDYGGCARRAAGRPPGKRLRWNCAEPDFETAKAPSSRAATIRMTWPAWSGCCTISARSATSRKPSATGRPATKSSSSSRSWATRFTRRSPAGPPRPRRSPSGRPRSSA